MEEEREQAVWARVRGTPGLPIQECARCAGLLRTLYKRGLCRETTAWLLKKQMEQLETIRGIYALLGEREPGWVMADAQGLTDGETAAEAAQLCRALAMAYSALEEDASFGGLYRLFSRESWAMVGALLRVYREACRKSGKGKQNF